MGAEYDHVNLDAIVKDHWDNIFCETDRGLVSTSTSCLIVSRAKSCKQLL